MIIQNVSRKTHILSFLRRKEKDPAIRLTSGQAVDLAAMGYKDEELKNLTQLNMLLQGGEIKQIAEMPPVTAEMIQQANDINAAREREQIIEKVKSCFAVTLIEHHQRKAHDNKDTELEQICKDRLAEIYGAGGPVN